MKEQRIIILNGPNLNLLGKRQPEIYGNQSFDDYFLKLQKEFPHIYLFYFQSNHEGDLIDRLHENGFNDSKFILNAGGYTHTSIAIRDAISSITSPVVEVHISDIKAREPFRHHSYLTDVCVHSIIGKGMDGYKEAILYFTEQENNK